MNPWNECIKENDDVNTSVETFIKNKEKVLSSEETLLLIKYACHGTLDGDPSKYHKYLTNLISLHL